MSKGWQRYSRILIWMNDKPTVLSANGTKIVLPWINELMFCQISSKCIAVLARPFAICTTTKLKSFQFYLICVALVVGTYSALAHKWNLQRVSVTTHSMYSHYNPDEMGRFIFFETQSIIAVDRQPLPNFIPESFFVICTKEFPILHIAMCHYKTFFLILFL